MMRALLIGDDSSVGHTEVPSPGVTELIGFTVQVKLARFESTGASTFSFNHGDATGTQGIDVCWVKVC